MNRIAVWLRAAGAWFNARDALCFGGLAFVGYGLLQVYPPAAWCTVGAALFWLSVRR